MKSIFKFEVKWRRKKGASEKNKWNRKRKRHHKTMGSSQSLECQFKAIKIYRLHRLTSSWRIFLVLVHICNGQNRNEESRNCRCRQKKKRKRSKWIENRKLFSRFAMRCANTLQHTHTHTHHILMKKKSISFWMHQKFITWKLFPYERCIFMKWTYWNTKSIINYPVINLHFLLFSIHFTAKY